MSEQIIQPKGKRTKTIRLVAVFEKDTQTVRAVDQAVCRHLIQFGFFQSDKGGSRYFFDCDLFNLFEFDLPTSA